MGGVSGGVFGGWERVGVGWGALVLPLTATTICPRTSTTDLPMVSLLVLLHLSPFPIVFCPLSQLKYTHGIVQFLTTIVCLAEMSL